MILRLYTEFQSPAVLGTGQKVCGGGGGGGWWVLTPIIVLSLAQAEQFKNCGGGCLIS